MKVKTLFTHYPERNSLMISNSHVSGGGHMFNKGFHGLAYFQLTKLHYHCIENSINNFYSRLDAFSLDHQNQRDD
jgi:hypothetical protein